MEEEIKKLFKNAGADKWTCSHKIQKYCDENKGCRDPYFNPYPLCKGIKECTEDYKDEVFDRYFSPEMQLEVLKVLIDGLWVELAHYRKGDLGSGCYYAGKVDFKKHFEAPTFEETLAGLVNRMWGSISESARERIREILQ